MHNATLAFYTQYSADQTGFLTFTAITTNENIRITFFEKKTHKLT